jgi:hypothetical protein
MSDIIDELIWSRVSKFWTTVYDQNDREALSSIYEAYLHVLDAEYVRLWEIDASKSIATAPTATQRRWLRLDVGKYTRLRDWLRKASGADSAAASGGVGTCAVPDPTPKHWHLAFPVAVSNDRSLTLAQARVITVGFPIIPQTVKLWNSNGQLLATSDYTVGDTTITLNVGTRGEAFWAEMAWDFNGADYNGFRPIMAFASAGPAANKVTIPSSFYRAFPVAALVVEEPPLSTSIGFVRTNTPTFSTRQTFVGYTAGARQDNAATLELPFNVPTGAKVLLFGVTEGEYTTVHRHQNVESALPVGTHYSWQLPVPLARGIFGSVGLFGNPLSLFIDGLYVPPTDYSYDVQTNEITFRTAIVVQPAELAGRGIRLDYQTEALVAAQTDATFHTHLSCVVKPRESALIFKTFDDAGLFDTSDDVDEEVGTFDDSVTTSTVTLDGAIPVNTLAVFQSTRYRAKDRDYIVRLTDTGYTISVVSLDTSELRVDGFREGRLVSYSRANLTGSYGFFAVPQNLEGLLGELNGVPISAEERNLFTEAARVAAAGGNPMLVLFYDEFPELEGYGLNATGLAYDARTMRNLESADTKLLSIPYLVDHVYKPTVRLEQGVDYDIVDGNIESSVDLSTVGVWWCPLVVLDERLLAKNFGTVLGDVRDTAVGYREALRANLNLRYNGPTYSAMQDTLSVFLGSPAFTTDATVRGVETVVLGYDITVQDRSTGASTSVRVSADASPLPAVGAVVHVGQSLLTPPIYEFIPTVISWTGDVLILDGDYYQAKAGDRLSISLTQELGQAGYLTTTIGSVTTRPNLLTTETHIRLIEKLPGSIAANARVRITRVTGRPLSPYDGTITAVTADVVHELVTSAERIRMLPGRSTPWRRGQAVSAGMAVHPDLVRVFDTASGDWHKERSVQSTAVFDATLSRGNGFAVANVALTDYVGYEASFVSAGLTRKFNIVAVRDGQTLLSPNVAAETPGLLAPILPSRFTYPVSGITDSLREITFTTATSVALLDGRQFPDAGLAAIGTAETGIALFEFRGRISGRLANVKWRAQYGYSFPAGTFVRLMARHEETRVRPSFVSAVQERAADPETIGGLTINELNADDYFRLLSPSMLVVETTSADNITVMRQLVEDCSPPSSAAHILAVHAVDDSLPFHISDTMNVLGAFTVTLKAYFGGVEVTPSSYYEGKPVFSNTQPVLQFAVAGALVSTALWQCIPPIGYPNVVIAHPNSLTTEIGAFDTTGTAGVPTNPSYVVAVEVTATDGRTVKMEAYVQRA